MIQCKCGGNPEDSAHKRGLCIWWNNYCMPTKYKIIGYIISATILAGLFILCKQLAG